MLFVMTQLISEPKRYVIHRSGRCHEILFLSLQVSLQVEGVWSLYPRTFQFLEYSRWQQLFPRDSNFPESLSSLNPATSGEETSPIRKMSNEISATVSCGQRCSCRRSAVVHWTAAQLVAGPQPASEFGGAKFRDVIIFQVLGSDFPSGGAIRFQLW